MKKISWSNEEQGLSCKAERIKIEMSDIINKNLESIYTNIKNVLDEARNKAVRSVNFAMVQAYWHIGRLIVEEEQNGKERADYGRYLIKELSKKLSSDFGKGFDGRNLWYMRSFYTNYPNMNALRSELTWTHYRILLRIENHDARSFYLIESINSNWSTRELERQINPLWLPPKSRPKIDQNKVDH